MKELVVISGKGGTGKTSLVASFACLASQAVLADCDVDAADLHLVLDPEVVHREEFSGGSRARILEDRCTACGTCADLCRFEAILQDGPPGREGPPVFRVDPIACEGCGVCAHFCPENAVAFGPVVNGEWFVSRTRFGPMVHARLGIAEENSGKLVSLVRRKAQALAGEKNLDLVILDGSPGIGCPVIASITGAHRILIVTEPTLSGLHDLKRVSDLAAHFGIKALVCVNKWDLNEAVTETIEAEAKRRGLEVAGRIRYDRNVTEAQIRRRSVVEFARNGSAADIRLLWDRVCNDLHG